MKLIQFKLRYVSTVAEGKEEQKNLCSKENKVYIRTLQYIALYVTESKTGDTYLALFVGYQ